VTYTLVKALDTTYDSLEEFILELLDLPLGGPMLTSSISLLIFLEQDIAKEVTKRFLFTISLLGAPIQDSGKKERSDAKKLGLAKSGIIQAGIEPKFSMLFL